MLTIVLSIAVERSTNAGLCAFAGHSWGGGGFSLPGRVACSPVSPGKVPLALRFEREFEVSGQ